LSRHYGDWSIIDNENIHKILAKGGKYRDPLSINWRLIPFQKLLGRCFETGKLGGSMITKATSALKYPEVAETLYTIHDKYVLVHADKNKPASSLSAKGITLIG
jgi:hypothetical protein